MNLPDALLPPAWQQAAWALLLPVLAICAWSASWRRLGVPGRQHLLFGGIAVLLLLWSMRAGVRPGLDLHVLGATLLTLVFGPRIAVVATSLVVLGVTGAGMAGWSSYGLNSLLMGVLPVATSAAWLRFVETRLPHHFFVYVFGAAFFGAGLAMLATGVAATGLLAAAGVYPGGYLLAEYLPFFVLMAWSEALLTGMAITIMVVYFPAHVATFDDARYIHGH